MPSPSSAYRASLAAWATNAIPASREKIQVRILTPKAEATQSNKPETASGHSTMRFVRGSRMRCAMAPRVCCSCECSRVQALRPQVTPSLTPIKPMPSHGGIPAQRVQRSALRYYVRPPSQVQRLSTDFRAATAIISEPLPSAQSVPPGHILVRRWDQDLACHSCCSPDDRLCHQHRMHPCKQAHTTPHAVKLKSCAPFRSQDPYHPLQQLRNAAEGVRQRSLARCHAW